MRSIIHRLILLLGVCTVLVVADPAREAQLASVEEDVLNQKSGAATEQPAADGSTTFNGMAVPPMKDMNGDKFEEEAKEGYW